MVHRSKCSIAPSSSLGWTAWLLGMLVVATQSTLVAGAKSSPFIDAFAMRDGEQDEQQETPKPIEFTGNPFLSSVEGYPNWSAFTGVEWKEGRPHVRVDNEWYQLVEFHGIEVEAILKFCIEHEFPIERRFTDDLVQLVRLMGYKIDRTTDLVLLTEEGKKVELTDVEMTVDNQRALHGGGPVVEQRLGGNPFFSSAPGYPNYAAFAGIRWKGDRPHVEFEGEWYELVTFHDIAVEEIIAFLRTGGWPFRMRFSEDLVQVVRLMGHPIEKRTTLVLRDEDGVEHVKTDVLMTEENLRSLTRSASSSVVLSSDDLAADLLEFQTALETQFAYLKANNVDYQTLIESIGDRYGDTIDSSQLSDELRQIMARFIDGHASVSGASRVFRDGYLPFVIESSGDRFVAVGADRTGFVHADYPYIVSIDGRDMDTWLKATSKYIRKGPPQSMRRRGLRMLLSIEQFRRELELPVEVPLEIGLADERGNPFVVTLDVVEDLARSADWPKRLAPSILDNNIGYFRIGSMSSSAVDQIREAMKQFRDTDGLIVDVRGNGGGIRTPLLELAGYLMTADDSPRIGNVAKYRLAPQFGPDHLSEARYVYRIDSERFDQRERDAIEEFAKTFRPEWEPAESEFSEWHYLLLYKRKDDQRFDYQKPVVILMDGVCFSATDIFLGALKGFPNVTLMGQPSGGGSARTQSFQLSYSGISIRCASMASFKPNGQLYDNHGIQPDVVVVCPPEYFLLDQEDVVLKRAVGWLTDRQ